ncbi:MAG: radical SAM protein [Tissierellia bacterium]|nr:radical SAM protein [Tissierellia bacterium]
MGKKHFIIPIFVPHLGCPHDCVFCNQERITGASTNVTAEYVEKTIEAYLSTLPRQNVNIEVAFYGGSFTGIDIDMQKQLLSVPHRYKERRRIDGIRLSTRPDYIDQGILDLLKGYGVDTIELGVQSLKDEVLNKNGRGHNSDQIYMASELIKDNGFNLGLQMMIGLVGDTMEYSIFTAKELAKLDPYCVRIYPTLVIRNTHLEGMYRSGIYDPLSLRESIEITTYILMLFQYYGINVIRVGLQPTDRIRRGGDVVAGPFHPSYRQLVESNIYRVLLENYLGGIGESILSGQHVRFECNYRNISYIAGQKAGNTLYLIDRYGLRDIRIYEKDISENLIEILVGDSRYNMDKMDAIGRYLRERAII